MSKGKLLLSKPYELFIYFLFFIQELSHYVVLATFGRLYVFSSCALQNLAWNEVLAIDASKGLGILNFVYHSGPCNILF